MSTAAKETRRGCPIWRWPTTGDFSSRRASPEMNNSVRLRVIMSLTLKLFTLSLSCAVAASTTGDRVADMAPNTALLAENSMRELDVFRSVGFSAADAIKVAENRVVNGRAVDVSFDGQADPPVYRLKTYRSGKIWIGTVNALTHQLTDDGIEKPVWSLDDTDRTNLSDFGLTNVRLSDAIAVAEKEAVGKAVSAGLGNEHGRFFFSVVVLADGRLVQRRLAARPLHRPDR